MKFYEYQAKHFMAEQGISVPVGQMVETPDQVEKALNELNYPLMVKAQIHAGGRGKVGAIKKADNKEEALALTNDMLGKVFHTKQTGAAGLTAHRLWLEECSTFTAELYISLITDRERGLPVIIVSAEGGMDIEELAETNPEKILTIPLDPEKENFNDEWAQIYEILAPKNVNKDAVYSFLDSFYKLYYQNDTSLIEVNPLAVLPDGGLIALDGKMETDQNAEFRHKEWADMVDKRTENPNEVEAASHGLNYVKLDDGIVGCMVNGAGLAMATMDVINQCGGKPANFLDVGGSATAETVTAAFRILARDPDVKSILVNIFGGIMKCDVIAQGIITALQTIKLDIPLVVRLEGTNVELGLKMLDESDVNCVSASNLTDAANSAVKLAKGE